MGQREDDRRPGAALEKMGDCTTADDPGRDVTQTSEPKPIATTNPDIKNPPTTALRLPTASPSMSRSPSPLPLPSSSQLPPSPALSSPVPSTSPLSPSSSSSSGNPPLPPCQDSRDSGDGVDLPTRIFRWLSTATPDALGAVGVGLAATTYFVLGRVGLVLMGAFGGVVLFAAWEARNPDVSRAVRGETGTEALARILEYHARDLQQKSEGAERKAVAPDTAAALAEEEQALGHAFDGFRPETRLALSGLVDSVMLEYIKFWYEPLVPADQSFVMSCRRVFTSFLVTVSNHLSRKRPADAFLDFLTNSSSIVIVFFSELASAFAEMPSQQQQQQQEAGSASTIMAADAIYNYLASRPDSNLANLLDKDQQTSKLRMVADDLLGFLDRQTYEFAPAHTFLREILASAVLESTLQTCSKPEWINGWIVYMLEAGEPDFSQAIDVGMQTRTDASSSSNNSNGSSGASAAASKTAMYVDLDGNVGNIALAKMHRKESMAHRKQLSRADEEMEEAMEEMKRINQMIADEDARRKEGKVSSEVKATDDEAVDGTGLSSPSASEHMSPKASLSLSGDESARMADGLSTPLTPRSSAGESPSQPSFAQSTKSEAVKAADAKVTDTKTVDTKAANGLSTPPAVPNQFTSFDQLVPPGRDEEEASDTDSQGGKQKQRLPPPPALTLHNATITIHDEPVADKGRLKSKPTWDFLVQIEPANPHYPGWMIVRKYGDFEKLHEVLRRIATISGATAFTEQHSMLPSWKVHTRGSLRGELERYVRDACWFQALAESEGMKRFLEKDVNNMGAGPKTGLQAFESMGKNMLDALANAPKGVAEGSKSMVGGMTGVLGNIGNIALGGGLQKRHGSTPSLAGGIGAGAAQASSTSTSTSTSTSNGNGTGTATTTSNSTSTNQVTTPTSSVLQDVTAYTNRLSISTPPRTDGVLGLGSATSSRRRSRDSMDSQRSSVVSTQPGRMAPMEQRHSFQAGIDGDGDGRYPTRGRTDIWGEQVLPTSNRGSRASSLMGRPTRSLSTVSLSGTRLSYLPSGGESGFAAGSAAGAAASDDFLGAMLPVGSPVRPVRSMASASSWPIAEGREAQPQPQPQPQAQPQTQPQLHTPPPWKPAPPPTSYTKQYAGISEGETRVAVELLFAVINELYTLSSAWNIRRTLLAAAKSFLLRPGNPSLASIQALLQASVLDGTTSDSGLAAQLQQLRAKALPTDAERAAWPQPLTAEEKERLRVKARRLLIQSGVPAALMGVMGQTATADALGRVFDCLQIEDVARGLLFGILLQAARVVTH